MTLEQGGSGGLASAADLWPEPVERRLPSLYGQFSEFLGANNLSATDEYYALVLNTLMVNGIAAQLDFRRRNDPEAPTSDDELLGESLQADHIDTLSQMVTAGEEILKDERPNYTPFHSVFEFSSRYDTSPSNQHYVERLRTVHRHKYLSYQNLGRCLVKESSRLVRSKMDHIDSTLIAASRAMFKLTLGAAYRSYTHSQPGITGRFDCFPAHYFVPEVAWRYVMTMPEWTVYEPDNAITNMMTAVKPRVDNFSPWFDEVIVRIKDGSIWGASINE